VRLAFKFSHYHYSSPRSTATYGITFNLCCAFAPKKIATTHSLSHVLTNHTLINSHVPRLVPLFCYAYQWSIGFYITHTPKHIHIRQQQQQQQQQCIQQKTTRLQ